MQRSAWTASWRGRSCASGRPTLGWPTPAGPRCAPWPFAHGAGCSGLAHPSACPPVRLFAGFASLAHWRWTGLPPACQEGPCRWVGGGRKAPAVGEEPTVAGLHRRPVALPGFWHRAGSPAATTPPSPPSSQGLVELEGEWFERSGGRPVQERRLPPWPLLLALGEQGVPAAALLSFCLEVSGGWAREGGPPLHLCCRSRGGSHARPLHGRASRQAGRQAGGRAASARLSVQVP